MNFLYTENTISNPVDSIILLEESIVIQCHSTIKVYDLMFNLLIEKHFMDKILCLKKVNENEIMLLFDYGKIIHCDILFNSISLRMLDGDKLDVYNGRCVLYNRVKAQTFNILDNSINEFNFSMFKIYSPIMTSFIRSYIPTLFVIHKDNQDTKCSLINIGGQPTEIDEFKVLDGCIHSISLDKFLVFITRNCIQIKFKRDVTVIILNNNLNKKMLDTYFREHPSF